MLDVLNYGGGHQSTAMCVLVAQGRLPRPEVIVAADTGREPEQTWAYMREHVNPLLQRTVGLTVEVAPHSLATVDLYKNGELLLPVFTSTGKLQTFCSNEWKLRVVRRYLRSKGYGPARPVRNWLGFSTDEVHRAKPSDVKWATNHWPLLFDVPLSRGDCRSLVEAAGLPTPPRSSCWMCPHRTDAEWRHLRETSPLEFQAAVEMDEAIRAADTKGGVFLHRQLVPLGVVDLDGSDDQQPDLFECANGCWT